MSEEVENTLLEIVYQDDFLVAINKPHGLLVHRSPIAADASEFVISWEEKYIQPIVWIEKRAAYCFLRWMNQPTEQCNSFS